VGQREAENDARTPGETKKSVQSQGTGGKGVVNPDKEKAASMEVLSFPSMPMSSSDAAIAAAYVDENLAMFTDSSCMKATHRSGWAFAAFAVTEPIGALPGPEVLGPVAPGCWGPVVLAMGARPVMRNQHKKAWPKGDRTDGFAVGAIRHSSNVGELAAATQAARHLDNCWKPPDPKSAKVAFCVDSEGVCTTTYREVTPSAKIPCTRS
jgi:hypothetical protein